MSNKSNEKFDVGKESGGISGEIAHWCAPDEILRGIEYYSILILFQGSG